MRPPAARSPRLAWLAPLAAFAAVAGVTAIVAVALLADDDDDGPATDRADAGPAAAGSIAVRDAPSEGAALLATLPAGTLLRIEGRSADGGWLAVTELGLDGRPPAMPVAGWAPAAAIDGVADAEALTVVDAERYRRPTLAPGAGAPPAEASPTLTPDVPDLLVEDVYARANRLVVLVSNGGSADAEGPIEVSVDGGPAQRIDVGKPLRPGDTLEGVLESEYVQLRAAVTVTVRAGEIREENAGNNTFSGVVAPDEPNDLEVFGVELEPDGDYVVVIVRNNSPIPLGGAVTIGVRQTAPTDQLLLREQRALEIEAGGTQRFELTALTGIGVEFLRVILSTDAISDADSANNTFPR
jgi:hypothetical protein